MKRLFAVMLALICSLGIAANANADSQTIDLKNPVPSKLELNEGDSVVFENGSVTISAKETDGNGELLASRPHNTFNQISAFRAVRVGTGEITVTFPSQGQLTVVKKVTIAVTVKAVHKVEFKAPYPQTIQVEKGDKIVLFVKFKGDPGLYNPGLYPQSQTSDGKKGEVLDAKGPVRRLDRDNIQVKEYSTLRAGDAEIQIKDINGKTVGTIKVTVK